MEAVAGERQRREKTAAGSVPEYPAGSSATVVTQKGWEALATAWGHREEA
jgi:hypothetical protein